MHLHDIGDDLACRAAEIDGDVIDGPATDVIDVCADMPENFPPWLRNPITVGDWL
jgi:hypothetical protein